MIRPEDSSSAPGALLITRNLPPLRGGMERLCLHIAESLADGGFELSVIGPDGCPPYLPVGTTTIEVPSHSLVRFLVATALGASKAIRRRFRLVLAGSGLVAPIAWWAARRSHSRLVVYLHGLDIIAPSMLYQHCWLPFIRRADLVLVNSRNTRSLAIERGVPAAKIKILHPGANMPAPATGEAQAFRDANRLGDRPVMLAVGRLTPRKGLARFVQEALPRICAVRPDTMLLIIGDDAEDAVNRHPGSERLRILQRAEEMGLIDAVRILPPCNEATLSAAYRAADIHVFPVVDLPGDVEGFGMVAIEASAHGLPTVAFSVGGVPDAVVDGVSGNLAPAGDYGRFADLVLQWLERQDRDRVNCDCITAATAFSRANFSKALQGALTIQLRGEA